MHRAVQFVLGFGVVVSVGAVGLGIAALWDRPKPSNPVHVASPLPTPAAKPVPWPKAKVVPMPVPVAEGVPLSPPPRHLAPERPVFVRTSKDLWIAYNGSNIAKADLAFTGKVVEVEFAISDGVGKFEDGVYYVKAETIGPPYFPGVVFVLSDDPETTRRVATAPRRAAFRLRGRCVGRKDDFLFGPFGFVVLVEDTKILATYKGERNGVWVNTETGERRAGP